jgi:uncharacterized protein YjiS (DUF1127 family)
MTTLDIAPGTSLAAGRAAFSTRAVVAVAKLYRYWQNRRAFYRLSDLTDRELQDIGLTRADLNVAVVTPLGVDPTARLRSIVEARQAA